MNSMTRVLIIIIFLVPIVAHQAWAQPIINTEDFKGKVIEEKIIGKEFLKIDHSLIKVQDKLREQGITKQNARERDVKQFSTPLIRIDDEARIQVYIHVTSTSQQTQSLLMHYGLEVEIINERLGIIQGWIPEDALETISQLPFVKKIAPPSYATPNVGSVTTEGDGILLADELRAFGFDGTGVKVGVISDGVDNMADSVATGDLPSGVTVFGDCSEATTCNEGTAMLEIVHDLAPGAELAFGAGMGTTLDFIARIDDLVNFGAEIIVDDVAFMGEPYFEDGPVADRVREATDAGIVYVSCATNYAEKHYEAEYKESYWGDVALGLHDFGGAAGEVIDQSMNVLLAAGASLTVILQWNDEFGASGNDYDLLLNNYTFLYPDWIVTHLASSIITQDGDDDPIEFLTYENPLSETIEVEVMIRKYSGIDRQLEMFLLGDVHGSTYLIEEFATPGGSIFGHAAVTDAIAVGAINASDDDVIEVFSSQGPSEIYFPTHETRQKPDIAAIDGVSVTGAGGFSNPFFGTSAAAPHVAGLAALLMEFSPNTTSVEIREALKNSAIDLGVHGFDYFAGYGRADVLAAAELLNDAPESVINEPASNATIETGESVTFSGTCTDANNTQGMSFSWNFGGGSGSGIATSSGEDPGVVVFGSTGTFTVTFTCTDGFGIADASPATRTITVVEPAQTDEEENISPSDDNNGTNTISENTTESSPASGGCSLRP